MTNRKKQVIQDFMYEDLKDLEYHTNELIENIYVSGQKENFKKDIEETERIINYWKNIAKNLNK